MTAYTKPTDLGQVNWVESRWAVKAVPGGATSFYNSFDAAVAEASSQLADVQMTDYDRIRGKAISDTVIEYAGTPVGTDENGVEEHVWTVSRDFDNGFGPRRRAIRIARRFVADLRLLRKRMPMLWIDGLAIALRRDRKHISCRYGQAVLMPALSGWDVGRSPIERMLSDFRRGYPLNGAMFRRLRDDRGAWIEAVDTTAVCVSLGVPATESGIVNTASR